MSLPNSVYVCVFPSVYVFYPKYTNGKEAVALHSSVYSMCYKHQYLYFGALNDGKQASMEQLVA
jgi:hypothetical protein